MQNSGIERRRAPRASASFPISLSTKADAAPATLRDISQNGLRCTHAEALREMTMVRIDMKLPGDKDVHQIDGVVVRCAKLRGETPPTYEIAVYFATMSPEARVAVESFVGKSIPAAPH